MNLQERTALMVILLLLLGQLSFAQIKIAFVGDTGIEANAQAVAQMIKAERAEAVVHAGDLDYYDDPNQFEQFIDTQYGVNFPYFFTCGNHDRGSWRGPDGYQAKQEARFKRLGITWDGQLGLKSAFTYKGIFFIAASPEELGVSGNDVAQYIKTKLAGSNARWKIAFWHKNQRDMQVGYKSNEVGWGVYEESRKGGAIVITGHSHTYSRTYLMKHMERLEAANTRKILQLAISKTAADEGRSFAVVSGLGGKSIRPQWNQGTHFASTYTRNNNAQYGALFGNFQISGNADFYFKDINGKIVDQFTVKASSALSNTTPPGKGVQAIDGYRLAQNYPNPFNPKTTIQYVIPKKSSVKLTVYNAAGEKIATLVEGLQKAGSYEVAFDGSNLSSGVYLCRLEAGGYTLHQKMMLVK